MAAPGSDTALNPSQKALPLALGSVKFGRNRDVKYPLPFELPDDAALATLLDAAWEWGVRLYDTAPAYGDAEERLRPFVQRHRHEILLCTKAGEEHDGTRAHYDFSGQALRSSCERSLRRLGCERLEMLLLHSDAHDARLLSEGDAVETLQQLQREGKVRRIGISAKTSQGIDLALPQLDVIMAPFGSHDTTLAPALQRAHGAGKVVLAIKTLASGHVAQSARDEDGASNVERALHFVLTQPFIDYAVLGTLSVAHLQQAVDVARRCRA